MEQINVKIYGIGEKDTNYLRSMLSDLFAEGYDVTIRHVEDVDEMMSHKLKGIPAVSINGELVFQDVAPSRFDLENWVISYLFKHSKPFAMKNILVPVDFSGTSRNAFLFAQAYAKKTNATIKLLHVYNSPLDAANPAIIISLNEQEERHQSELRKMIGELSDPDHKVPISFEARLGFAVDEIVNYSKSNDVDLIIMGTMGEHLGIEKVFGTVSSDVSQQAHCPVMLIPPDTQYKNLTNILFASDYTATEGHALDKILGFAKAFDSALHFVHVNDKSNNIDTKPEELIFEKVFKSKDPQTPMFFAEVKDASVTDGLNRYIKNHEIDLLTIVSQKRTFWERLFHKSTTKKMALNSEVPLLVLHV